MGDKPEAKWEPGTLDKTRQNIGPIDAEEAKKMMQKLGGEVFAEKSAPIDYSAFPKARGSWGPCPFWETHTRHST